MAIATIPKRPRLSKKQQQHALALHTAGQTHADIADAIHVHRSTISRYLQHIETSKAEIAQATDATGPSLHTNLTFHSILSHKLLTDFLDEALYSRLTDDQKIKILQISQTNIGIMFDKIRLHEGKSTVNTSHRIVRGEAYQSLDWDTTSSMVSGEDTKGLPSNNDVENVSD